MPKTSILLQILADGKFHSGQELATVLGVSRTAIWKQIQKLKNFGLDIFSVTGKGHRLSNPIELLNKREIESHLSGSMTCKYNNLELFYELNSTNQYLMEKLATVPIHRHIVLSEYQSSGKGRRGRHWLSPFGSGVCISIGWHFNTTPESLTSLSLATGVAVADALQEFTDNSISLKWPNDILNNNRKTGGILIESLGESAGPCDIVIGIGVNVKLPEYLVNLIEQPVSDLSQHNKVVPSRNKVAAAIISQTMNMLEKFTSDGFSPFIGQWRQYDRMSNKQADLILPNKVYTGKIKGIDDNGLLIMLINNEEKAFSSGELSLRVIS